MTLGELARSLGLELVGGDSESPLTGVGTLSSAGPRDLAFYANRRYSKDLSLTRAGAVLLESADRLDCPVPALVSDNPYLAYARAASMLRPRERMAPAIHASAVVAPGVRLAANVAIGPLAVVEAGVELGDGVEVGAGCFIGKGARVGEQTLLYPKVTLMDGVIIGKHCIVHAGAVIGADGFGFANDDGRWEKVPQLGSVLVGDHVEIGALTTVDRGAIENTVIADGVKLDNQIQIAHNVSIGKDTAIAACVGIAGSTKIGQRCTVGGAAGISGHIEIADDCHVTGMTMVSSSLRRPGVYSSGILVMENKPWLKMLGHMKRIGQMAQDVKRMKQALGIDQSKSKDQEPDS